MKDSDLLQAPLAVLLAKYPFLRDFFAALSVEVPHRDQTLESFIRSLPESTLASSGLDHPTLSDQALAFIRRMAQFTARADERIGRVTVRAGFDKDGQREPMDVTLSPGEVVSIVGPTGSGKSRLLADIECLAQGDTPSGRRILLDGKAPDDTFRFSGDRQLVAQLSQNMNFVMDLTVEAFLRLHAESRLVDDGEARIARIFESAKGLAGEPFSRTTPVTALSGGQSRALMVADVAFLSASPIVLIDEIENAGVDRQAALNLLVKREKIVLMATHDPLLALSGHRRIVIRNGGIAAVLETSKEERAGAACLSVLDRKLTALREQVRQGKRLDFDAQYFGFQEISSP